MFFVPTNLVIISYLKIRLKAEDQTVFLTLKRRKTLPTARKCYLVLA